MSSIIKIEIKKAFRHKLFWITLLIASVIALISGFSKIQRYYNENSVMTNRSVPGIIANPDYAMQTLFNSWIGQDYIKMATSLFFLMLPLFAAFPYAWSYFTEYKSGYIKNVISRTCRKNYYLSKYIAVFLSGAIIALIPMLLNIMLVSSFIPAVKPDVFYDSYYAMPVATLGSVLFYDHPWFFMLLRLLLITCFSGLFAVSVIALSFFVHNKVAVLLTPFLVLLALNYLSDMVINSISGIEISPLKFIHAGAGFAKLWIVLLYAVALFVLSLGITMRKGLHDDVF